MENILKSFNISILKSIFIIIIFFIINSIINTKFTKIINEQSNNFLYEIGKCINYSNFQCFKCYNGYKIIKGKCILDYSFRAIYSSSFANENIILINKLYGKFIEKLIIDNKYQKPSINITFPEIGLHEIKFSLNMKLLYSTSNMFSNITNLLLLEINNDFENKYITNMSQMFNNCSNLKVVKFNNNIYKNIIDLSYMFNNCISLKSLELPIFTSNKLVNISYMFSNCTSLKSIIFPYINTVNIENMSGLFYGCSDLTSFDLSDFNNNNLKNVSYMFAGCSSLSFINMASFKMDNVQDLNFMFKNCMNLTAIILPYLSEKQNRNIDSIFQGCNQLSLSNILRNVTKENKTSDICIVGAWYGRNYGSMLTYYALHEAVKRMGYSILMVNDPLEPKNVIYNKIDPKSMISYLYNISNNHKYDNLTELNKQCKCFLTGSDQLWNIYLSRPLKQFYFLDFVDDKRKKLSYATSFGIEYRGTEEEKKITKVNLERFDGISVRDKLSLNICKQTFGIKNAIQVCDPTFLCDISDYIRLAAKSKINIKEEYILSYLLDPNPEIGHRLEKLSIDKNIKVIIILDYPPDIWEKNKDKLSLRGKGNIELKDTVNLNDWLFYYNNSKAIFTDSFHGTIFSIIFKKPFISLRNIKRGGERFSSLLRPLYLMNRLFENPDCINKRYELYDEINYNIPLLQLKKIKNESYNWLKDKLNNLIK